MQKCVMIVDDAKSMRGLVAMTLKNSGYHVVEASDGTDALKKIAAQKVHMIITDFNMPNMNGLELIRTLKSDSKHRFIPIVMLTMLNDEEKKRQGQQAGAKAWIVKPFKPETMVTVVKKVIG